MSKRVWKRKPPSGFQTMIEEAAQLRLYIIHENGPTSFTSATEQGQKYKILIGETIQCSCSSTQTSIHCVHTLHAMLKKFKVDQNHPIIWQTGYTDSEITDLIAYKFQAKQKVEKQIKIMQQKQTPQIERHQLQEDTVCPICYEEIKESEPLTFCKKQCGNNFHIRCIKIWVEQRQNQGKQDITCPICRADWGSNALNDLRRDEKEYTEKFKVHKAMCKGCHMKPIVGEIYQCIHCSQTKLCAKCYIQYCHFDHNYYLTKERIDQDWMPIARTKQLKDELQFYYECFPICEQSQGAKLAIVGLNIGKDKVKCDFCQRADQELKSMKCGHAIDRRCFHKLMNSRFICPLDDQILLEGYNVCITKRLESTKKQTQPPLPNLQQKKSLRINSQPQKISSKEIQNNTKATLPLLGIQQKRFNEKTYDKSKIIKGAGMMIRQKVKTPQRNMDNLIQVQQIGQGSSQRNLFQNDDSDVVYF